MTFILRLIIQIPILLLTLTIHEFSHGYVAYLLGDDTAKRAGRLTLNPISHIDPFGLVMLFIAHIGWAKPVPINPHNFKNFKKEGTPTNSDERIIYKAGAYKYKNFYIVYFLGNGFLRSQVRMMSDFALKVEKEKLSLTQLKEQLECKKIHSRSLIRPNGLYLSKIHY